MNMFYISLNDNAMILLFITSKMTRIYTLRTTPHQAVTFLFYRYIEVFFRLFLHFTDLHFNKCHLSFCRFFVEKMKTIYFCSFFFEEEIFFSVNFET